MQRNLCEARAGLVAAAVSEDFGRRAMEPGASTCAEPGIDRVARQCMGEAIAAGANLVDKTCRHSFLEWGERLFVGARDRGEGDAVEILAEHGRPCEGVGAVVRQALDSRSHDISDSFRHVAERRPWPLRDVPCEFPDVEGVAGGA